MSTRIDHVKYNGQRVEIFHSIARENDERDETIYTSHQQPLPAFKKAMENFADFVTSLCDIPTDWKNTMTVIGVSLPVSKDGEMGLVITVKKRLSMAKSPLIFNTPYLPSKLAKNDSTGKKIPKETLKQIDELIFEAGRYLSGERLQQEIFDKKDAKASRKKQTPILPMDQVE